MRRNPFESARCTAPPRTSRRPRVYLCTAPENTAQVDHDRCTLASLETPRLEPALRAKCRCGRTRESGVRGSLCCASSSSSRSACIYASVATAAARARTHTQVHTPTQTYERAHLHARTLSFYYIHSVVSKRVGANVRQRLASGFSLFFLSVVFTK